MIGPSEGVLGFLVAFLRMLSKDLEDVGEFLTEDEGGSGFPPCEDGRKTTKRDAETARAPMVFFFALPPLLLLFNSQI